MTKQHDIAYYQDGFVQVAYCRKCSAEGQKLLEDCPQKIFDFKEENQKDFYDIIENTLDENKPKP